MAVFVTRRHARTSIDIVASRDVARRSWEVRARSLRWMTIGDGNSDGDSNGDRYCYGASDCWTATVAVTAAATATAHSSGRRCSAAVAVAGAVTGILGMKTVQYWRMRANGQPKR
jgi:hypothetical protein